MIEALKPLGKGIDLVDDTLNADISLAIEMGDTQYVLNVKGNIYEQTPEKNQALVELKNEDGVVLGVYLKDGEVYLNQEFTRSTPYAKFSRLDGTEFNKELSKLPGIIKDLDLNLEDALGELRNSDIADLLELLDMILEDNPFLTYKKEGDTHTLKIVSEELGKAISSLLSTMGDKLEILRALSIRPAISFWRRYRRT